MRTAQLDWPLMPNNVTMDDRHELIEFLKSDSFLTNGKKVLEFEEAWSRWLGVKYSVFVNSGASANLLTMSYVAMQQRDLASAQVIVPTLTWVSDVSSVLQTGMRPIFADIETSSLGMSKLEVNRKINKHTAAVFVTHVLGLVNDQTRLSKDLLIEDCCESHGADINGRKIGTFGRISNFSFYFGHHMTTIEGGMVCTDDEEIYETMRMLRSHGMVREVKNQQWKEKLAAQYPKLHPAFLFLYPAFNMRSTELNAVLGLSQLKRLDENIEKRRANFKVFLNELSPKLYRTDYDTKGMSPYGLIIALKEPDFTLRDKVEELLTACKVEFRRGLSGGGNQLRQPYLKQVRWKKEKYPEVEHITDFSWYVGNFPSLEHTKIKQLCQLLNQF